MLCIRQHLAALLITQQIIGQIREAVIPFIFFRRRAQKMKELMDAVNGKVKDEDKKSGKEAVDVTIQEQANLESTMDVYEVNCLLH